MTHILANLGWVDFDLRVPSAFLAGQLFLPISNQLKQNQAGDGTAKIKVYPTLVRKQMHHPVELKGKQGKIVYKISSLP